MKRLLIAGGLIVILLAGFGFFHWVRSNAGQAGGGAPRDVRPPVRVAEAISKDIPAQISTIGHVETISFVAVRPRIDGTIAKVMVVDGQKVKAGDPLFLLDDREAQAALRMAEANLKRDQAQLQNARQEVARIRPLLAKNYATKQQMDQLMANLAAQEAAVAADQAQIEERNLALSYTSIMAPIEGRLGTIAFKVGNVVRANDSQPLVTINQMQPIYVSFSVTQQDIPALQAAMRAGQPPRVEIDLPGSALSGESGVVSYMENNVDPATNGLTVKASFANLEEQLWPGQFVNVIVTLSVEKEAVTIPVVAIQNSQSGTFVWVVKTDSTVEMRKVTIGRMNGEVATVREGLKIGEQVVVEGYLRLKEGIKVNIEKTALNADSGKQQAPL